MADPGPELQTGGPPSPPLGWEDTIQAGAPKPQYFSQSMQEAAEFLVFLHHAISRNHIREARVAPGKRPALQGLGWKVQPE